MDVSLTWEDLLKLAANRQVVIDGVTVKLGLAMLPYIEISPDGSEGFVRFTRDETAPRTQAHGNALVRHRLSRQRFSCYLKAVWIVAADNVVLWRGHDNKETPALKFSPVGIAAQGNRDFCANLFG